MKISKCPAFAPVECVNGHCPKALYEEYDWYDDAPKSCHDCWYNVESCSSCIFEYTPDCPRKELNKK